MWVLTISLNNLYFDLQVDKALSEGQLVRYYKLSLRDLPAVFFITPAYLAVTHHSRAFKEMNFITCEPKHRCLSANALRHLAGTTEMRHLLNADRTCWQSEAQVSFASEQPDALWHSPRGDVAIEFDAGSYSAKKIEQKINTFKSFSGQVWGSSSLKRVAYLQKLLQQNGVVTPPVFSDWS